MCVISFCTRGALASRSRDRSTVALECAVYGYVVLCLIVYVAWIAIVIRLFRSLTARIRSRALSNIATGATSLVLAPGLAASHSFFPFPALPSAVLWSLGLPETWFLLIANVASMLI